MVATLNAVTSVGMSYDCTEIDKHPTVTSQVQRLSVELPRRICFLVECFQQDRAAVMLVMVMTHYDHDQLLLT